MDDVELKRILIDLETTLLKNETRKSSTILDQLLHDNFLEIGSSGRKYNKLQTIQHLDLESRPSFEATDFNLLRLSDSVALLTYTLLNKIHKRDSRQSIRGSVWKLENEKWKLIFHQGTPTKFG